MALSPMMRRLEQLETRKQGRGGLWLIRSYADDPQEGAKIEAAEAAAIKTGAGPNSLFVTVRRFAIPDTGYYPAEYPAAPLAGTA